MKARNARETGICNIREELYGECLDELIRQITINCLQRGDLLNSIKLQANETIMNYQKLYESVMAYQMRKVLIVKVLLNPNRKIKSINFLWIKSNL